MDHGMSRRHFLAWTGTAAGALAAPAGAAPQRRPKRPKQ